MEGSTYSKATLDDTIQDYTLLIALDPGNARLLKARGEIRQRKGDIYGAICDFEMAIWLDPALEDELDSLLS